MYRENSPSIFSETVLLRRPRRNPAEKAAQKPGSAYGSTVVPVREQVTHPGRDWRSS